MDDHKAHDWSTARESAAVEAEFGKGGLEAYKQHWRDAASVASEPTDRDRHPHAHTTRHGLDESELGKKFPEGSDSGEFKVAAMDEHSKFEAGHGVAIPTHKPITPEPGGGRVPSGGMVESIYSPAIKSPTTGDIHMGDNHGEAYRNAFKAEGVKPKYTENGQGFVTSTGRYVSRKEAAKIAKEAGQIQHEPFRGELTSEDLDPEYVKSYMDPDHSYSNSTLDPPLHSIDKSKWTDPDEPFKLKK